MNYTELKELARLRVIKNNVFFGSILYRLTEEDNNQSNFLAAVVIENSQLKLKLNRDLITKYELTKEELAFVLGHEICHVFLLHLLREPEFKKIFNQYNIPYDHQLVNIAVDYAANFHIVNNFGFKFPDSFGKLSLKELMTGNTKPDESKKFVLLYDSTLGDYTAEEILKILLDQKVKQSKNSSSSSNSSAKSGNDNSGSKENYDSIDDHSKMFSEQGKEISNEVKERVQNIVKNVLAEMRQRGNIPGNLEDYLSIKLSKKQWRLPLLRAVMNAESKIKFPNKKLLFYDCALPKFKVNKKSNIVISIDCSGSISDTELQYFFGEVYKLLSTYNISVIQHDAVVTKFDKNIDKEYFKMNKVKVTGRGGTNFKPVFEFLDKEFKNNEISTLIMFTDCEGSWPQQKPKFQTIVVNVNYKRTKPPVWAKEIQYDLD